MKHDLHALAFPLNTFPYSDEKSPKRRRLVLLSWRVITVYAPLSSMRRTPNYILLSQNLYPLHFHAIVKQILGGPYPGVKCQFRWKEFKNHSGNYKNYLFLDAGSKFCVTIFIGAPSHLLEATMGGYIDILIISFVMELNSIV